MNFGKIERAAVRAVEEYIDQIETFEPFIFTNDKAPILDGYFNIYNKKLQRVEDFFAQIPVQVKGRTTDQNLFFRIESKYIDAYKQIGGIVFFKVLVDESPKKILYAILSNDIIDDLLKQPTKTIKIDLEEVPVDKNEFERKVQAFALERIGLKNEFPSPKEIKDLVKEFKEIEYYLKEVEDRNNRNVLKYLLNSIKKLKDDGTIGWRDQFIYLSKHAIDLVINNINNYDCSSLLNKYIRYLYKQKQFYLTEEYSQRALKEYRRRSNEEPSRWDEDVAMTLNNLANLHDDLSCYDKAEEEYIEALVIYRALAEKNPEAYIEKVATTLNNLASLHYDLSRYDKAEAEYNEALVIYKELANMMPEDYNEFVANTLNNLALLHFDLYLYDKAETEYTEALKIYKNLAMKNPEAVKEKVATALNNLAYLHNSLTRYDEAKSEYNEALTIRRELAKNNPDAYNEYVANTLNDLAILHKEVNLYKEAEDEFNEALTIRRDLAKKNPEAYVGDVAMTIYNLANLHNCLTQYNKAEKEYAEALKIRRELAKKNPEAYNEDVAGTLNNLAALHYILKNYKQAEDEYNKTLAIYWELAQKHPNPYLGKVAITFENITILLLEDKKRRVEARDACEKALGIFTLLDKKYPQIWTRYVEKTRHLLDEIESS